MITHNLKRRCAKTPNSSKVLEFLKKGWLQTLFQESSMKPPSWNWKSLKSCLDSEYFRELESTFTFGKIWTPMPFREESPQPFKKSLSQSYKKKLNVIEVFVFWSVWSLENKTKQFRKDEVHWRIKRFWILFHVFKGCKRNLTFFGVAAIK